MPVYLDNNATTVLDEEVLQAMMPYLGQFAGNPSSVHRFGRLQRDAIEQARHQVAQLVGARAEQVMFTSGGTESNNLVLEGFQQALLAEGVEPQVLVSAVEHMSVLEPAQQLTCRSGILPVDNDGRVQRDALVQGLTGATSLVSVMTANNETGVIQTLAALIDYTHERGGYFHSDASQAAGKMALNFIDSGLDAMTLSAHKIYGPAGAGALVLDKRLPISKRQFGGSQEKDLRAGTENVAAIVGFGKAAELAARDLLQRTVHSRELRDALERGLQQIKSVRIFASSVDRLPNTVQFGVEGFDGETLLMQLDRKAIAVSSGSACTSGKTEPSHVLRAMQVADGLAQSAIRVSFGKDNTMSDVDALLTALGDIIETNRHSSVMIAASV